jgi:predicted amidohydrolase YtcJ
MATPKADLVLHGGVVAGHPGSDSVAVDEERILAHGSYSDLKPLVGPRTRLIPLAGSTVAPGFIDCHLHFMEGASVASGLSVLRCRTISDLLADLRIAAGRTPPGNWLRAFGCDESLMAERRGPTREELDQSTPKNPLRLRHQTLHGSWLNSRAISLLGLEKPDFRPPDGSVIWREVTGRLSGLVVGMEEWLGAHLPRVTPAELDARARVFSRELASAGITAFTDATARNDANDLATFGRLSASGAIHQRVAVMVGPAAADDAASWSAGAPNTGVRLAGVKFIDVVRWGDAQLARAVAYTFSKGLDCAFHCTEVEELEAALTATERARELTSPRALEVTQCRIEHGGLIPPDYPERIAALGAWIVTDPGFIYYRGAKYAGDPGLIPYLYRARSLAAAGIRITAGTDAPVTPAKPLTAIAAAMSRVSAEGYELALEEKLDAEAAFALFTKSASILSRLEAGAIEPGRLADLIVLPANPLTLDPAALIKSPIDITIIAGRVVYERGRPVMTRGA